MLNPPLLRPIAWSWPSFFGPRHCAGARAQWCCRSWRIHCPHRQPEPRTPSSIPHSRPSERSACELFIGSPKRSGRSRQGMPARYRYSTASTNSRLFLAVTPTCPSRPGRRSLRTPIGHREGHSGAFSQLRIKLTSMNDLANVLGIVTDPTGTSPEGRKVPRNGHSSLYRQEASRSEIANRLAKPCDQRPATLTASGIANDRSADISVSPSRRNLPPLNCAACTPEV